MIGSTISHYKILEKLGEGGMGVVYKAHDTKLDRLVALKFLPYHLTSNESEKARFLQEARAASALNHPNVCIIYRIEEHDGQQFIEMEFVDGVTLKRRCESSPLSLNDAMGYAIQVGEALQEAHSKGIVHRDIKSENVMVNSKNQIKVMDFGLAKLKGSLKLTRTSSTVGTLSYMAPEQITGGEVDHRSDIFSFGVLLFEMLTGHFPFRGEHEAAMVYSIVNEEAETASKYLPDSSPELLHIFSRSLEKDPDDRYQSVGEMVVDLRRLKKESAKVKRPSSVHEAHPQLPPTQNARSTSPAISSKSTGSKLIVAVGIVALVIAGLVVVFRVPFGNEAGVQTEKQKLVVLPFENLGNPDQEYFADGITEEITSRLSGLSGLAVIARSSAKQYKKTTKTLKQIGEELGVGYVLQGSIRWSPLPEGGSRVRINPALVKISDETQVWSQPYEAVMSDVFRLQSDIAAQVVGALGISLMQPERRALEAPLTANSEAYDYFLRGKEYYNRSYNQKDWRTSEQLLRRALELDPRFAAGHAVLSKVNVSMYWFFYDHTEERVLKAKSHAEQALALDPYLADAHGAMGYYYYHGRLEYDKAIGEFEAALKLQPNNVDVIVGIASVRRRQGRASEALDHFLKAIEVDPRATTAHYNVGETYGLLRRYADADRNYSRAISLAPDGAFPYISKAWNYISWTGDVAKAMAVLDEAIKNNVDTKSEVFMQDLATILILSDRFDEALSQLSSGPKLFSENQFQFSTKDLLTAIAYSNMGKPERARPYYQSATTVLDEEIRKRPDDARLYSALGLALAGLGRKEEAIRVGKRGVDLMPVTKEAWRGAYREFELAKVYAIVGDQELAIDILEHLLTMPFNVSAHWLRLDPVWTPLRTNARFQKLIAERS
ncbi:MAG TPA: protein kinase [Bacteroidota bacterium]|nr:protein kinase [Bacteroidota bacterium]